MPVDLFKICCELVADYDSNLSPAAYFEKLAVTKNFSDYDVNFISEVFYGCCDRRGVLDVVVDGFYSKDGQNSLRSERCIYTVLTYIVLFRVKAFGIGELKALASYPHKEKVYRYLNFFLNDKNLLTWVKDAWSTKFESSYVEEKLMRPLFAKLPILNEYVRQMENEIFYTESKAKKIPPTKPEPFNITQPAPRKILLPEPVNLKNLFF